MGQVRHHLLIATAILALGFGIGSARAQSPASAQPMDMYMSPQQMKWGPAPSIVPKGAQAAVLTGDPFKAGSEYTLRLKMPAGYKIPPHWHPTDENITVLSGTLGAGLGDKFDKSKAKYFRTGGFVRMPKEMHHYAWANGPTTIQVHGTGPFAFIYVNPSEDPRIKK